MMKNTPQQIFDNDAHRCNRNRHAATFDEVDYLKKAVAERIIDRLDDISRDFPHVLDVGCHTGLLTEMLAASPKIGKVTAFETSPAMAAMAAAKTGAEVIVGDYDQMPFAEQQYAQQYDAIFSAFSLHWANDLLGVLIQLRQALKPDGVMIIALAGGATLGGLRNCFAEADSAILGGLTPRISPMGDIRDLGGLLGRAGLTLPVADSDRITISYPDFFTLLAELRHMGEANAMHGRFNRPTPKSVFLHAAELYAREYSDDAGRVTAEFDIITLTGWAV